MIVVVRKYDVLDAVPAQRQQHARVSGISVVRRKWQRREQHPQPLDFLAPRFARQQRVHDGQLHGRVRIRSSASSQPRARRTRTAFRSAAQAMELKIGDRG